MSIFKDVVKLLWKEEPTVHGTHSTSAVNQSFQPYRGVRDSRSAVPPHHAYTGSTGISLLSLLIVFPSALRTWNSIDVQRVCLS